LAGSNSNNNNNNNNNSSSSSSSSSKIGNLTHWKHTSIRVCKYSCGYVDTDQCNVVTQFNKFKLKCTGLCSSSSINKNINFHFLFRVPVGSRIFSTSPRPALRAHPVSYPTGTGGAFARSKAAGAWNWSLTSN
jgi:hypothetical protein